jgi:hypothetical protein
MTIAPNPSTWYSALWTYKGGQFHEHGPTIGALTYRWLRAHRRDLEDLLDGPIDYLTIVPSKRGKETYATQPLRLALSLVPAMGKRVKETLRCDRPLTTRLADYDPSVFETVRDVAGDRIILIEDTWISGATALSAAGNLIEAGAAAVVVVPIAREIQTAFHGPTHPYMQYLTGEYNVAAWPR